MLQRLSKVPVLGWLIGAIVVLLLVIFTLFRRVRILSARIRVETQIASAKRHHTRAIKEVMKRHANAKIVIERNAASREKDLAMKKMAIEDVASSLPRLSDHVNTVFGSRNK